MNTVPVSPCPKDEAAKHFSHEILSPRLRFIRYETLRYVCLDVSEIICQVGKLGPWETVVIGIRQIGYEPHPRPSRPLGETVEGTGTFANDFLRFLSPLGFLKAILLGGMEKSCVPIVSRSP